MYVRNVKTPIVNVEKNAAKTDFIIFFLYYIPLPIYVLISLSVGVGVFLMIFLNVTHPPAGGNPIIVIIGSVSIDYLINPIIIGSVIILIFGIVLNRLILGKKYPN